MYANHVYIYICIYHISHVYIHKIILCTMFLDLLQNLMKFDMLDHPKDLDFLRRKLRDTQSGIGQAGKPRPDLLIGYALMLELSDPRLKELYMLYADPYL